MLDRRTGKEFNLTDAPSAFSTTSSHYRVRMASSWFAKLTDLTGENIEIAVVPSSQQDHLLRELESPHALWSSVDRAGKLGP